MSFLVQRSDVGEFRRRYRWLVLFVLVVFSGLIARLVQLQIVEGDQHRAQARRNIVRERYLATTRGVIRDAYGRVLAGAFTGSGPKGRKLVLTLTEASMPALAEVVRAAGAPVLLPQELTLDFVATTNKKRTRVKLRGTVDLGGPVWRLEAGDFTLMPTGLRHALGNSGHGPARWLSLNSPRKQDPDSGRVDTIFEPAQDLATMDAAARRPPFGDPTLRFVGHYVGTPPQLEALAVKDAARGRAPIGMDVAVLA